MEPSHVSLGITGSLAPRRRMATLLCAAAVALLAYAQAGKAQVTTAPDYVTEDQIGSLFTSGGSTTPASFVQSGFGSNDGVPYFQPAQYGTRLANGGEIVSAAYNLGNGLYLYAYEIDNGAYSFAATTLSVPFGGAPLIPVGPVTTGAFSAGNFVLQLNLPNYGIPEPVFTGVFLPFYDAFPGLPDPNSTLDGITSFSASGAAITFTTPGAGGPEDLAVGVPSVTLATPVFGFITNVPPIVVTGQFAADANGTLLQPAFQLVVPADPQLVDPVPGLLSGSTVTTDANTLATQGRSIAGVAADGVTEAVLRVPTTNVGDQVTLTIQNFTSADEMGALGNPGDTQFTQSTLTVNAKGTTNGPMAFAIYRAPLDFPRASGQDASAGSRIVDVQAQITSLNSISTVTTTEPILIVRPLVVLVHGLWGSASAWDNFMSFSGWDQRFSVQRANYGDTVVGGIAASSPSYDGVVLAGATNSSLGILFNASSVADQVDAFIGRFKDGENPAGLPVAAVQADFVAHSMGGDVVRALLLASFNIGSFPEGVVHKLVTIGTPHLGTPLAIDLLPADPTHDPNSCVRDFLADNGDPSFLSATLSGGTAVSGGVGDLEGDGAGGSLSGALQALAQPGQQTVTAAMIAGVATSSNLSGLDSSPAAIYLKYIKCPNNPLAEDLDSQDWPTVFSGGNSDAVVPESSQLDQQQASIPEELGVIHSSGLTKLGFHGPDELDPGSGAAEVIGLLNTPVTDASFRLLPP
jgi:pimeloyl-ACP methyl ester carboxylesterase